MRYAVFGTGIVGRTIAAKLAALGHQTVIGTRDVEATLARTQPDSMGNPPFTQWHASLPEVRLKTFADNLAGKVLIDIANPLDFSAGMPPTLNPVNTDSLGEQIQRAFPDAKVVKTLNTMNCEVMVDPSRVAGAHTVFVSGNDAEAKNQVTELLLSFGWPKARILDLGDITAARGTEMLLPVWLRLWGALGHADFNFHIAGT